MRKDSLTRLIVHMDDLVHTKRSAKIRTYMTSSVSRTLLKSDMVHGRSENVDYSLRRAFTGKLLQLVEVLGATPTH